jgi:hypothetical protein
MLTLTHAGPAYRSPLISKGQAAELARNLREEPRYTGVQLLESTRSSKRARYYVVCLPTSEEMRQRMLAHHQQERIRKAEEEGPRMVWLADPVEAHWHVLSLSGELYQVSSDGDLCTCRDAGVCRDNGLLCKHSVALKLGLGTFFTPELAQRLQQLQDKLQQPPAPRLPVAVPVAA